MSKEIQFKEQLTFNKRADDGNHMVYFDVDPTTDQLIIAGNYQSGVPTSLGGLIVDGDLFQAKGDAEVFRTLTSGGTITAPDIRVDDIFGKTTTTVVIKGPLRVEGDLIVTGDEVSNGEVLISDPIQILNTEDPGPGMTSGIGGMGVQRGTPIGENTPGGVPGLGASPTAYMAWNEPRYAWDMNYDSNLESGNPKLYNVGTPTVDETNVATNVGFTKTYVADQINSSLFLDTLQDVTIIGDLATNRVLLHTGTQWEPKQFRLANLDDTPDKDAPAVSFGYLRWNVDQTAITYEPTIAHTEITGLAPVAIAGTSTLPNLEDASIGVLADGQVLRTDGSLWRNAVLDFSDLSGTPTSASYTLTGLSDTTGTAVANGYLRWNATGDTVLYEPTIAHTEITGLSTVAVSGTATIDNLENVTIATPASAQILQYNGTLWENAVLDFTDVGGIPDNSSYTLTGLSDTTATSVNNGYLRWNATGDTVMYETSIAWEQLTGLSDVAQSGQGKLDVLTDTNITSPAAAEVLRHDGASWKNTVLAYSDLNGTPTNASYTFSGLSDTDAIPLANGYLQWDSTGTSVDYVADIPSTDITGLSTVAISGTATITNLEDTTIVTPVATHVIRHDGTNWKNAVLSYNDLSDLPAVSGTFIGLSDTTVETISNMANKYVHWDGTGQNLVYDYASAINAGTAVKLSTTRANYLSVAGPSTNVVGELMWKNYGNNHTIFDASQSTAPDGTAVDNSTSAIPWSGGYPTLMGWNGSTTYGVKVDRARLSDTATQATNATNATNAANATNAGTLDNIDSSQFLRSDVADYLTAPQTYTRGDIIAETAYRDHGIYGTYDSTKTQHIWSMGTAYRNNAAGSNYGNLYGLAYKYNSSAGGHSVNLCQNGNASASLGTNIWSSGNIMAYSDIRVKTNIEIIPNALDKINELHGYTFDRTDVDIDRQTGVIAQEIQKVLPEAVNISPENNHLSVSYGNLAGLFIEGIRALDAKNISLEKENKFLHSKIKDIMSRLESLEEK